MSKKHGHRKRQRRAARMAGAAQSAGGLGVAGKAHAAKANVVWHQTPEEATLARKPKFNGYACGHGAHGDAKYNRARDKRAWRKQLGQEGASRGPFPFGCRPAPGETLRICPHISDSSPFAVRAAHCPCHHATIRQARNPTIRRLGASLVAVLASSSAEDFRCSIDSSLIRRNKKDR